MQYKLRFNLEYLPHPFTTNPSQFEAWGRLIANIHSHKSSETLFRFEYNLESLATWFIDTSHRWDEELLLVRDQESQSQAFDRFHTLIEKELQKESETEVDQIVERLSRFSQLHDLSYPFSGLKLPRIHISCKDGVGEIS